jgi:hypothetical protein
VSLASATAAASSGTRAITATGPNVSSRNTRIERSAPVRTIGSTHEPSRNPPVCCRAPAATDSSTCARSASAKRGWASGPIWVDGSVGSPTRSAAVFSMTACSKASATGSTTMRRLALMQAWPAFVNRDATAPAAACSMSASSSTTKESEPPSSRTDVFSSRPAIAATLDPARSEPVSVTPRTRGSARICSTASTSLSTVWNVPSGKPVSGSSSAMRSAQPGTLGACVRSTTLPATSIAGAKRKTCT